MKNQGRREQIFEVCSHLYNSGIKERHKFTYSLMYDTCESLGYPRGNQKVLAKYRDEWLDLYLKDNEQKTTSHEPDKVFLQSSLEALLNEHKQKIEQALKEEYIAKFDKLIAEKDELVSTIDLKDAELIEVREHLKLVEDKFDIQQTLLGGINAQMASVYGEKADALSERNVARQSLIDAKEAYQVEKQTLLNKHEEVLALHKEQIESLKQQLHAQKESHQQNVAELLKNHELQQQALQKHSEKLEQNALQVKDDYNTLQKECARQEMTINLLERERGEFYREFNVMRKQFEQMPKLQSLIKGQETLIDLVKKITDKEGKSKTSQK